MKENLQRAAELLRRYASVVRDCHSHELERFDYLPEIEDAAKLVEEVALKARPEERAQEGLWAKDDPRHAFVMGAKWWQYKCSGATAFASEVDAMEREANRRYQLPSGPPPEYDPVSGKCRGDCDCSIGQTCKAYLAYQAKKSPPTMNEGGK